MVVASRWVRASVPLSALIVVAVLAVGGVGAAPTTPAVAAPAAGSSVTLWAYGAEENISFSVVTNHTTYSVVGWTGYHVILTQTNTSNSTYMLELNRTFGVQLNTTYCSPSCGTSAKVSFYDRVKAWETDIGFANFTRAGTVYENGSPVAALALQNASERSAANVTEAAGFAVSIGLAHFSGSMLLFVALATQASVAFTPALGLIPNNVTAGTSWNSTSQYTVQGSALGHLSATRTFTGRNGTSFTQNSSASLHPSVNSSGTVSLNGRDFGTITLKNGVSTPVIGLSVLGPFEPREGLIFLPSGADLFGQGDQMYSADAGGTVGAATSFVDWAPGVRGHLGLEASETGFGDVPRADAMMGGDPSTFAGDATGTGMTPMVGSLAAGSGPEVQAQPESVPQAQAGSQCILGGSCLTSSGPGTPGSGPAPASHLLGTVFIVGVVVVLAGLLAGLIATRRSPPRPPASAEPAYPRGNVAPMQTTPNPPAPARPAGPSGGPDAEPDPLGHLW